MPLQATSGAASYDAFGGGVPSEPNYIESVFSCFLYTGTGSTQTITNGIDLAGKGGLVWTKARNAAYDNWVFDTARGAEKRLITNSTTTSGNTSGALEQFNSNGYQLGYTGGGYAELNKSGKTYASWTFRKQPKFFDVVTYTGNGAAGRQIPHNLGSAPGCIIVKNLVNVVVWRVYHRSLGATKNIRLNDTAAFETDSLIWNDTDPTSTVFTLGTNGNVNASGQTYVAYLFAHNAGGFGLTGTDNVISCGSFTSTGSALSVNLGYEPQWLLFKPSSGAGDWNLVDNMRGFQVDRSGATVGLQPSLAAAEDALGLVGPTATGFTFDNGGSGVAYIYIAIRRGPMKVPTDGTKVFSPVTQTSTGSAQAVSTSFPVDFTISRVRGGTSTNYVIDRLRGSTSASARILTTNTTDAEYSGGPGFSFDSNTQITDNGLFGAGTSVVYECFRRAPGFFDEICFSGTGSNTTQAHNLQKAPELWIIKSRSATTEWVFGSSLLGANEKIVMPSPNGRVTDTTVWNNTYPTASVLSLGTSSTTNASGATFVGYLMATAAGVSKVGTYTGNGSSQTIDCGFAGGARFVMIIRATASTAQDIYVWDSARGIVSGNDPRLSLNTTAAEVTTLDTIDTASSGFVVNTDASNVNVNGAVYLYWSIA